MSSALNWFERIVRNSPSSSRETTPDNGDLHPFDERNIHPDIVAVSRKLFDDGHYSQATFEAFKYLEKQVQSASGLKDSGQKLMLSAFDEAKPRIKLNSLQTVSERDEQGGYRFMFAGATSAIRNPRGHDVNLPDTIDLCLDHLSIASVLLRRLQEPKQDKS